MDRSNIPAFCRLLKTFQTLVSLLLHALSAHRRAPVNVFCEVLSRPLCVLLKGRWDGDQTTKHLTFVLVSSVSLSAPSSLQTTTQLARKYP